MNIIERIKDHHGLDDSAVVGVKAGPSEELRVNESERTFRAIANTSAVDLDDEVVVPEGADIAYFKQNQTLFYNHDYSAPIGKMINVPKLVNHDGHKAWTVQGFISRTPFANDVFTMMSEGVIRGTSIGFIAKENRAPNDDEVSTYGPHRSIVPSWSWLELSVTGFPCNASAMIQSVGKARVDDAVIGGLDDALRKGKISRKSARMMGLPDRKRAVVVVS